MVFATTFALLGYAIYGLTQLETKFESTWFLPQDSYVAQWRIANEKYYANVGERVTVYLNHLDYSTDLNKIGYTPVWLMEWLKPAHRGISLLRMGYC